MWYERIINTQKILKTCELMLTKVLYLEICSICFSLSHIVYLPKNLYLFIHVAGKEKRRTCFWQANKNKRFSLALSKKRNVLFIKNAIYIEQKPAFSAVKFPRNSSLFERKKSFGLLYVLLLRLVLVVAVLTSYSVLAAFSVQKLCLTFGYNEFYYLSSDGLNVPL